MYLFVISGSIVFRVLFCFVLSFFNLQTSALLCSDDSVLEMIEAVKPAIPSSLLMDLKRERHHLYLSMSPLQVEEYLTH